MPPKRSPSEQRALELSKTSGHDFAVRVATDLLLLEKSERDKALRMINAISATVDREAEAAAAPPGAPKAA